jgi:hypothetical protein
MVPDVEALPPVGTLNRKELLCNLIAQDFIQFLIRSPSHLVLLTLRNTKGITGLIG